MEIIVRDGGWFIANGGKPTFQQLKKNDIVFNAAQTKALLQHGKTNSYGKFIGAYSSGTAFASGSKNDYTHYPSWYARNLTRKVNGDQYGTTKLGDKTGLDWIERVFKKLENAVERFATIADNAGKTLSTRIENIDRQITDYKKISSKSQDAATRYLNEANRLGLDKKWIEKIQNGTIDKQWVASQTGSGSKKKTNPLLDKINEYIDLYDKSQEMLQQQLDAESKIADLYLQRFNLTKENYENKIDHNYDHKIRMRESDIEYRDNLSTPMNSDRAQKQKKDYEALMKLEENRQSAIKAQRDALQKQLNDAVKSGAVKKGSEEWYEMMSVIDKLNEDLKESRNTIQDYKNELIELAVDLFESIQKKWEFKVEQLDHQNSLIQSKIDQAQERGDIVSANYYTAMSENEDNRYNKLKTERDKLRKQLQDAMTAGTIKEGTDEWYDMIEAIDQITEEMQDAKLNLLEYENAIRQLKWDAFDNLLERISRINKESDFMIELLSHRDMFDDNGNMTDAGLATQGLHAVNYNTYMESARKYKEEIAALDKEFKNDKNDQNYLARRRELLDLQRESVLAAEEEKQSMLDLIKDGYDVQIDALSDLIDKYNDALDSAEDLYDFQRKTKKQTEEIARLEKQLASLRGDNSEEARQKIQQIQVKLDDARADLEESEFNKYVADQKKLFSELEDAFKSAIDDAIDHAVDNLDGTIREVIADVNDNNSSIYRTLKDSLSEVGMSMTNTMYSIWNGNSPVATFYNGAAEQTTNIVNALTSIQSKIDSYMQRVDNGANTDINSMQDTSLIGQTITTAKSSYTVKVGSKVAIEAKAQTTLSYSSSNSKVATVDSKGNIKGIKAGTAKITITASATSRYKSATKQVSVKVKEEEIVIQDEIITPPTPAPAPAPSPTPAPAPNPTPSPTPTGTQGDGKVQVGDKVKFKSGKYYGTSSGTGGSGTSNLGKNVYVTRKSSSGAYPYHISTGNKFGKGDLGWVKKSQITGFATGGTIGDLKRIAIHNGDDTVAINTFKKGEAVLTPQQAEQFRKLLDFTPNLVDLSQMIDIPKSGARNFGDQTGISVGDQNTEINIMIDHVDDYNDLVYKMQRDPKFERMIQGMSVDKVIGKRSSFGKYQYM